MINQPCNEAMRSVNAHSATVDSRGIEFIGDYVIVGHHTNVDGNGFYQHASFVGLNISATQQATSDCRKFVDTLVPTINLLSALNEGRAMAKWAVGELKTEADKHKGRKPTGFQEKYVKGGQNGYALVHVAGVAGATLLGPNKVVPFGRDSGDYKVYSQFAEDRNQLEDGRNRRRMGLKTVRKDGHPNAGIRNPDYPDDYPLNDYIDEKEAELEGDKAGVKVGEILKEVLAGTKDRKEARGEVFKLLCDW